MTWGYNQTGQRVLLDVVLGHLERFEDWLEMGRGLVRRGRRAPMLAVTDWAPGLVRAMEEPWPDSDRQRCTVHRRTGPGGICQLGRGCREWIRQVPLYPSLLCRQGSRQQGSGWPRRTHVARRYIPTSSLTSFVLFKKSALLKLLSPHKDGVHRPAGDCRCVATIAPMSAAQTASNPAPNGGGDSESASQPLGSRS